jgi:hypothetical protein
MISEYFALQNQYNQVVMIFTINILQDEKITFPESIISKVKFSNYYKWHQYCLVVDHFDDRSYLMKAFQQISLVHVSIEWQVDIRT